MRSILQDKFYLHTYKLAKNHLQMKLIALSSDETCSVLGWSTYKVNIDRLLSLDFREVHCVQKLSLSKYLLSK